MKNHKTQLQISTVVLILGLVLLVYMVIVESEPGALPLAMVLGGLVWNVVVRRMRGKSDLK